MTGRPVGVPGPLVFVADLAAPELDDDDRHHLERVLRLRPGAAFVIADGAGRWRPARLGPEVEPAGEVVTEPAPDPPLTVAFAPVKGDRPEWAVQKLTELGIDRIVVLETARSVVRWPPDRAARHLERWARVVRSAAAQSRRTRLPELAGPVAVTVAADWPGAARADVGGGPPDLERACVLVGPEGGWTDEERELAVPSVGLGEGVLRSETAAVAAGAALALLRTHRGQIGTIRENC